MSTRGLLLLVALIGGAELCVRGHLAAVPLAFHTGAWLLAGALWIGTRRAAATLRGAARSLAALLALLSLAELWPHAAKTPPEPNASFEGAHGDPEALARWWQAHEHERSILSGETELAPGQRFSFFDGEVELDESGLRRASEPPDAAFRIVAVGGSATFDTPLGRGEPTWPERLGAAIAADYTCARPVAVRNAGRPGRTLDQLGQRFDLEIAPLRPSLLLVYADTDVLEQLAPAIGALASDEPPARVSRPLRALERVVRARVAASRMRAALADLPVPEKLQRSLAARGYRRLLVAARTHGVDVAIATPALAVAGDSPSAAIRFHESVWPEARRLVVARAAHAKLVPLLGASYRAAGLDVGEGLDGDLPSFLDLIHVSPKGREQLARNLSRALEPLLTRPDPGCRARNG